MNVSHMNVEKRKVHAQ